MLCDEDFDPTVRCCSVSSSINLTACMRVPGLATDQLVTEVEHKLAGLESYEQLLGGIAQGGGVAAL